MSQQSGVKNLKVRLSNGYIFMSLRFGSSACIQNENRGAIIRFEWQDISHALTV